MVNRVSALLTLVTLLLVSGCGGSSKSSSGSASSGSAVSEGGAALAADSRSAATGDIPDNQNFLTLKDQRLHVSMLYPEGWTVQESGFSVSISDKNNVVRITVSRGSVPTASGVEATLAALGRSTPNLVPGPARTVSLKSGPAVTATYTTRSSPNPVTGKQVTLKVDRYEVGQGGRVVVVDLGTPVGVDNVDAYARMIESFKWQ